MRVSEYPTVYSVSILHVDAVWLTGEREVEELRNERSERCLALCDYLLANLGEMQRDEGAELAPPDAAQLVDSLGQRLTENLRDALLQARNRPAPASRRPADRLRSRMLEQGTKGAVDGASRFGAKVAAHDPGGRI